MPLGIEQRVKKQLKRQRIQDVLLASIYAITAVGVAVVAPNAAQLLKHVEKYIVPNDKLSRRIAQAITRLHKKGLVARVKNEEGFALKLTEKGNRLAESLEARNVISFRKPRKWDGKWRIIIFDVWEHRRSVRDKLRIFIQKAGFRRIQNSVWVYPYDYEELFVFLRTELRVGKGILYIVADEIEHDEKLRRHFGLPLRHI